MSAANAPLSGANGTSAPARVAGLDVARGVAVVGMVLVHAVQCLAPDAYPSRGLGSELLSGLDAVPIALFLLLAGMGAPLLVRSALASGQHPVDVAWRRGISLLAIGVVNMLIWPDDVLRIFALFLFIAPAVVRARGAMLVLAAAAICVLQAALLVHAVPFDHDWTEPLRAPPFPEYWWSGFLLLGARPLLPWAALLLLGVAVSRADLTQARVRRWLAAAGLAMCAAAAGAAWWLHGGELLTIVDALLRMNDDPPTLLCVVAASGLGVAIVALSMGAMLARPASVTLASLASLGRVALSGYVGHVALLQALSVLGGVRLSGGWALLAGVALAGVMLAGSVRASRAGLRGPLEALLRLGDAAPARDREPAGAAPTLRVG